MRKTFLSGAGILTAASLFLGANAHAADSEAEMARAVEAAVRPIMEKYEVPGMAVAVTAGGEHHLFNYGVASKENGRKVTDDTLFEIGSISKTFTATLASYAEMSGKLSLSDNADKYLSALAGSSIGRSSLLDLGTYTAGGLPLQFPDDVTDRETMIAYYRNWRPLYPAGAYRQYSNPSIGLFGYLAARSMGEPFDDLMEHKLFPMLGLTRTYIQVPQDQMRNYAFGYSKNGKPTRVSPGVLDSEAYGVKTTAADLIHFIETNIDGTKLDATLQRAITATHTGYHRIGDMTQGLGWEFYAWPVTLDRLLAGNSFEMLRKPGKATRLDPPLPPRKDILINKTGSTLGFGAYAAFVPAGKIGVVILANKSYPIPARVEAGYRILKALDSQPGGAPAR
ncbi:class C beta-lactamase [Mesorhizobium sp. RMAD-H1]|uniref:class C beta-lactamase n=1 Tax=Mesorhizobium sp. RMAD-H1 TaxID=2587065 RepID=UPI0016160724|nr:class C beta-lactamase [Mesorhizobium sp. RMAD-H1]MBB2974438.1 beta-lactamase class C [Mesorhizobium sp. RMAD-H1]